MSLLTFTIDTDSGSESVMVDTDEALGDLTPDEYRLLMGYVDRAQVDKARAMAGGALLVLLSRKLDIDHESLLEAAL